MNRRLAWPGRPVRQLRTQLLAAFGLVAFVALLAGGAAVVWLLLEYRSQATTQRLRDSAMSAAAAGMMLQRQGALPEAIAVNVAAQVPLPDARVLVLDGTGQVVADATAEGTTPAGVGLAGQRLDVPAPAAAPPGSSGAPLLWGGQGLSPVDRTSIWRGRSDGAGTSGYLFVAADNPSSGSPAERGPSRDGGRMLAIQRVVLAVPLSSMTSAWKELAPGLAGAASVALLAAAATAWGLAGSITRPIRAVTQATERVARGEPHLPVPEEGVEEVAQLARGFNTMVREVERSQETLRDFVADASHELRTPLTAIQGFSQAVEDGVLEAPDATRDAARHIHREAERMRRLVEDLLLLSKMEARDRTMVPAPVDVAELLDTLAQRLQLVAHRRGLRLVLELPERLMAQGDATQLEHLFGNLLENAAKYTPDGGTITVQAMAAPPAPPPHAVDGKRVAVVVHNTGSYIPPDDLPYVFKRFYRVDKSRARGVAGSGLGLAIAHEIAERHGGTIVARSHPAAGTTFAVSLPAATAGAPAPVAPAASFTPPTSAAPAKAAPTVAVR